MKQFHVLNLGAGVQSTALLLMSDKQLVPETIPRFDYAVFADTGDEPAAVYKHLDWLRANVSIPILTKMRGRLGDDLIKGISQTSQGPELQGYRFVSIPAFVQNPEYDREGRVPRQCTKEYKIDMIESMIRTEILDLAYRQRRPKDVEVHQYVGMSYDEYRRYYGSGDRPGARERLKSRGSIPHAPLIDLFLSRSACQAINEKYVPHPVPRSACVFCPYHSDKEWIWLKENDPEGWERACQVDEAMRDIGLKCNLKLNSVLYVHRTLKPLREIEFKVNEKPEQMALNFAAYECEGMCGV